MRNLIPSLVGFSLLLVTAASAYFLSSRQEEAQETIRNKREIRRKLVQVEMLIRDAETSQRGYLLTGRVSHLEPYNAARRELGPELDTLEAKVNGDAAEQQLLAQLRAAIDDKLAILQSMIDLRPAWDPTAAVSILNDGKGEQTMARIRRILAGMENLERNAIDARSANATRLSSICRAVLVSSAVLVITIGTITLLDQRRRLFELETINEKLKEEAKVRRLAESEVRQLQKMEALGQLVGGIAHDFNNMLAVIIGSLDMARRRLTGNEHPAITKRICDANEGAQKAATLTSRLLALSRQQALNPRVLDVNELASGMSELLRSTLGELIAIETVLSERIWRVEADSVQLESALLNLAVNARDAMPDGGKLIIKTANADLHEDYASVHSEVRAGQYAMIAMTDTGVGMPSEVIERAFDPFYTTKGLGKGTGLGLSQVFGFVKQSGGHVKICSEVGQGTTVKIYLPRIWGQAETETTLRNAKELPLGVSDETVLVVEDDEAVRRMSVNALRELGYNVVDADTSSEALRKIELQPDVTLLFADIVMPEMSGCELADLAAQQRPGLRVLLTTGYSRNTIAQNGMFSRDRDILAKPFTLDQLARKIRQTIDTPAV
jgi:signal transduction histidine kinase/ActR/RegA family two-component response regulator